MAEPILSQIEAELLISVEKVRENDDQYEFPQTGGKVSIPLVSIDKREKFLLDIHRSRIDLAKVTYQNRVRYTIPLVRIDIGGRPHTNPDGESIPCPHIHYYREGYDDKWAQPLMPGKFKAPDDLWETLQDFYKLCNISVLPNVDRGLFV